VFPALEIVAVLGLAAFRLTRLVTTDTITDPLRGWLYRWAWDESTPIEVTAPDGRRVLVPSPRAAWRTWLYDLLTCPWCLGVWFSAAVWALWKYGDAPGRGFIAVFAIAGFQGAIGQFVVGSEPDAVDKIAVVDDDRKPEVE
jgi:hypothetical protein